MTPSQKLKHLILILHSEMCDDFVLPEVTADNIDAVYGAANGEGWGLQEARMELRHGDCKTDIASPHSRNYEPYEVAAKAPDGSYIGWTYWTGGGKHSNPEEIDFVEGAYDLTVTEETQTVVVQTFTKVKQAA